MMKWNQISELFSSGILQTHTSWPLHLLHSSDRRTITGNCVFSKLKHFRSKLRIKHSYTYLQSILPFMSRSSKCSLPFRLSNHNFVYSYPTSLIHSMCPTHFIILHVIVLLQCPGNQSQLIQSVTLFIFWLTLPIHQQQRAFFQIDLNIYKWSLYIKSDKYWISKYRPLSLLTAFSKMFEKSMYKENMNF